LDSLKREAAEKRRKQVEEEDRRNREENEFSGAPGGGPGGMGGMGAVFEQLFKDPEIGNQLKDPETQKKVMEYFMQGKHAQDPVVQKVANSLMKKFPTAGAGAGPGGPGAGGAASGSARAGAGSGSTGGDDLD